MEVSTMKNAQKRTTSKTLQIETRIRSGIAALGVTQVAKDMGVHHSQISRMQTGKNCFVERAAKLLAVIGFDDREETVIIKGEQTAEVAKALISMLEHLKCETPYCANSAGASERKHMGL
ncbi:CII family transcriptional regulator [Cronobacter dublinensis]|uniref:CII family transcriptional regulator n=1 Tax=Cronobacter dublinensis TaxID=413497 RepID=UPI00351435A2